jgi:hypothetical protein
LQARCEHAPRSASQPAARDGCYAVRVAGIATYLQNGGVKLSEGSKQPLSQHKSVK